MFPRANTLGIIIKDNYILLEEKEGTHSKGEGHYYRPIGGTIELGEKSDETLVREFYEELGLEIVISRYISCLENIFRIGNDIGHEISQIYLVEFKDKKMYQDISFTVTEGNQKTLANWVSKDEIFSGNKILYPDGLDDLLIELF